MKFTLNLTEMQLKSARQTLREEEFDCHINSITGPYGEAVAQLWEMFQPHNSSFPPRAAIAVDLDVTPDQARTLLAVLGAKIVANGRLGVNNVQTQLLTVVVDKLLDLISHNGGNR